MKKFISTLQNIWKIEELRKRILYALALIFVFRFGTFVLLPGVNSSILKAENAKKTYPFFSITQRK